MNNYTHSVISYLSELLRESYQITRYNIIVPLVNEDRWKLSRHLFSCAIEMKQIGVRL